jgi:hypothetical protein
MTQFDHDALYGILHALSDGEQSAVHRAVAEVYALRYGDEDYQTDRYFEVFQQVLIDLEYIIPFREPTMEDGSREYEDAMNFRELMGCD